jgi:hypothetical protein
MCRKVYFKKTRKTEIDIMNTKKSLIALIGALIVTAAFAARTQVPVIIINDNITVTPLNGYAGHVEGDNYSALERELNDEGSGFNLFD